MKKLTVKPNESGVLIIHARFLDNLGEAFVPTTCTWTLTDAKGTVVNNRLRVPKVVSGTEQDFVLAGPDLVYAGFKSRGTRVFTVEGTYSSIYGEGLPFREEVAFDIVNTVLDGA